jgi:GNAT superfamily N-acetyltransferase
MDVVRSPLPKEFDKISEFIKELFFESIANLYDNMGREVFLEYIHPIALQERFEEVQRFSQYVVLRQEVLLGWMEVRDDSHISMLFVHKDYQRRGIGKNLIQIAIDNAIHTNNQALTLNSSPNSIEAYLTLGFTLLSDLCMINGVKFYEMKKDL